MPERAVATTPANTSDTQVPERETAIAAFMACGYSRGLVEGYVDYWAEVVRNARSSGYRQVHITGRSYQRYHALLEETLPDDVIPLPGSPADLLGRYLLDPRLGEAYLLHTNRSRPARAEDCYLMVGVRCAPSWFEALRNLGSFVRH